MDVEHDRRVREAVTVDLREVERLALRAVSVTPKAKRIERALAGCREEPDRDVAPTLRKGIPCVREGRTDDVGRDVAVTHHPQSEVVDAREVRGKNRAERVSISGTGTRVERPVRRRSSSRSCLHAVLPEGGLIVGQLQRKRECPQRDSNPRYHLERVAT